MVDDTETKKVGHTPPYIAYQSLRTLFGSLKEHGLPGRIDRSVLTNFSGAVGSQIITTLRFLDLINGDNRPTPDLQLYVNSFGTDVWSQELGELLKKAYAPIFELDLKTASPSQFTERFRAVYPNKEETLRKCITFFVNAARDAQIPISPYIMKNKKPRAANGSRKPKTPRAAKEGIGTENAGTVTNEGTAKGTASASSHAAAVGTTADEFKRDLLSKFPAFDPTWTDEIKAQWFAGFGQFMEMAKK